MIKKTIIAGRLFFPLVIALATSCGSGQNGEEGGADTAAAPAAEAAAEGVWGESFLVEAAIEVTTFKELLEVGGEDRKELNVSGTISQAGNRVVLQGADGGTLELATKEFTLPESAVGKNVVVKVIATRLKGGDGNQFSFEASGIVLEDMPS